MKSILENYIGSISSKFSHDDTSEIGYRTDFEILLGGVFAALGATRISHDSRAKQGNKPDFIVFKNEVPILYIETKDIGVSLDKIEKSEQLDRYFGYANLILTDYVEFRFYRNGIIYGNPIKIGAFDLKDRSIIAFPQNFESLAKAIVDFSLSSKEPIRSGTHLSKIMGGKARRIRDNIQLFFTNEETRDTELTRLYKTLKQLLVHDLNPHSFADMYAQTLVYGLFVARYYDKSPDNFTRQEARELIPNSNPFLRRFFDHIVGADFDKRLGYIVDELCEVFSFADVNKLMEDYFKSEKRDASGEGADPVIHFYEDFLKEYDPALRKKMGAYYTPQPVVQFIVNSVDSLLKSEFSMKDGIADTTKVEKNTHKVQILDPASGTGTFISAIINNIYTRFINSGQTGRWPAYVHHELLPRLYGFELMMAPYTIAHLKLGIAFRKTGFWDFHRRLGIYLTNSLEETEKQKDMFAFGLAESIAEESKQAAIIKNNVPIMVIVGNPPYSGESSNKQYDGQKVYKFEHTGEKLQEKNSKWLSDDYVKFIRFAESMVEKTGEGIVAMITAHGYIDNPTFRGMRYHLMKSFSKIYILDLHGNYNKKEISPTGKADQNVFDIKTGVSILFGIKKLDTVSGLAEVYHTDLFGTRSEKFNFLANNLINTVNWNKVNTTAPSFVWKLSDDKLTTEYDKGFDISELFRISSVGMVTARDSMSIQQTKKDIENVAHDFLDLDVETLRNKYKLGEDAREWKVSLAKSDVQNNYSVDRFIEINYRPFDRRWTYYTGNSKGFHCRPRGNVMNNLIDNELSIVITRQVKSGDSFQHVLVAQGIVESTYVSNKTSEIGYVFPLYIKDKNTSDKIANLNPAITERFANVIGNCTPEDILYYVYAILYMPKYREKYKSILKTDFAKIPYPKDLDIFNKLSKLGKELVELHLLKNENNNTFISTYPITGDDTITINPTYKEGNIFINDSQYFGNVPVNVWNYWIGCYQPIQKWLKDRKNRILTNDDIEHFQQMIAAINDTISVTQEIDKLEI